MMLHFEERDMITLILNDMPTSKIWGRHKIQVRAGIHIHNVRRHVIYLNTEGLNIMISGRFKLKIAKDRGTVWIEGIPDTITAE